MAKITDEELQQINETKNQVSEVVFELGQLEYQILSLQLSKDYLKEKIKELRDKEMTITTDLKTKYGNVNINIETGEF
jgi:hypothetical protein